MTQDETSSTEETTESAAIDKRNKMDDFSVPKSNSNEAKQTDTHEETKHNVSSSSSILVDEFVKQQIHQFAQTLQSRFHQIQFKQQRDHSEQTRLLTDRIRLLDKELSRYKEAYQNQEQGFLRLDTIRSKRNEKLAIGHHARKSPLGCHRILTSWKKHAFLQCEKRRTSSKLLQERKNQRSLCKMFRRWSKLAVKTRNSMIHKGKLKVILKEVISRYEMELQRLQIELGEARSEIDRGVAERTKLEENTKRLLLRGMMAMNVDALTLFSEGDCGGGGGRGEKGADGGKESSYGFVDEENY